MIVKKINTHKIKIIMIQRNYNSKKKFSSFCLLPSRWLPIAFCYLLFTFCILPDAYSQPQKMSYQAVIRNASNALVVSTQIGMQISILQGSATGTAVYVETQTPTTNANGLASLEIGSGSVVTGTIAGIDWSTGIYFIKTETDPAGSTSYTITSTSQLLSVPYALYAKNAGTSDVLQKQINMLKISTAAGGTITDVENNVYNTVKIGTQVWMSENLKTTKYNDGTTAIPNITDNTAWAALTTGAYSWYNNDVTNKNSYGALYNWYAVDNNAATKAASNGGKNVCPTGWHVPTDAEWTTLTTYLTNSGYGYGGSGSNIGKSIAATSGWTASETAGTIGNDQASNNSSGFAGFPDGSRIYDGTYSSIGTSGYWWSSTEAYYRAMTFRYSNVSSGSNSKGYGFSVRCLRD
jgi:uncharacterized protein (TIGR02145 family)